MRNDDNIGDFFRNNLNKPDNSGDAWDRPDTNVWADAQAEIFAEETEEKRSFAWLWLLAFLLISSVIGTYIWSLKKQVLELEKTTEKQKIAVKEQEKRILNLEQNAQLIKQNHSEKIENLKAEQVAILEEKEIVQKELLSHQNSIFQLQKENERFEKQRELVQKLPSTKTLEVRTQDSKLFLKPISSLTNSIKDLAVTDLAKMPALTIAKLIKKEKAERGKLKITYDYSFLNLKMPATNVEKEESKSIFNVENAVYLAPVHGLSIAYSPKKNLYIRAGIQQTKGKTERIWKISEEYDKSGEYLDAEGKVNNDLNYTFNTPYVAHDGAINVKIPEETELEDKANLYAEISDYQVFDYKKFSLGAEYLLGQKKLQWQLNAGLSWNSLSFEEYFSKANVKVNGEFLAIEKVGINQKSESNKSFMGLYSGIGLNYNISSHWSVGANLNYNLNLISNQKNEFAVSDLLAREVGLSVAYSF